MYDLSNVYDQIKGQVIQSNSMIKPVLPLNDIAYIVNEAKSIK
jgi:hypothetical protein